MSDTLKIVYQVDGQDDVVKSFQTIAKGSEDEGKAVDGLSKHYRDLQDELDKTGAAKRRLKDRMSELEDAFDKGVISQSKFRQGTVSAVGDYVKGSAALGVLAVAAGTAVAALGVVAAGVKSSADRMDELSKMAQKVGVQTDELSKLAYAAELSDLSLGKLDSSLDFLNKNLDKNEQVLRKVGVTTRDAAGNFRSADQIVVDLADVFAKLPDSTEKSELAMRLFGKSGADMIPLLNGGKAALVDLMGEAERLGQVVTPEAGKAAEEFNDNLTRLKLAGEGVFNMLAAELMPTLVDLTNDLVSWAKESENSASMTDLLRGSVDLLKGGLEGASAIVQGFAELLGSIGLTAKSVGEDLSHLGQDMKDIGNFAGGWIGYVSGASKEAWGMLTGNADLTNRARQQQVTQGTRLYNAAWGIHPASNDPQYGVANAATWYEQPNLPDIRGQVRSALAKPTKTKKPRNTSDADARKREAAAKRVQAAIQSLKDLDEAYAVSLQKNVNPVQAEYAKRLDDIAKKADAAKKAGASDEEVKKLTDDLTKKATQLRDEAAAKYVENYRDETEKLAAQLKGPAAEAALEYSQALAEANKQLQNGQIGQGEFDARVQVENDKLRSGYTRVIESLNEEMRLMGMSSKEQEVYYAQKQAGVTAYSEEGRAIADTVAQLQKMRDLQDLAAGIGNSFMRMADQIGDSTTSSKQVMRDFLRDMLRQILTFLAQKAVEKFATYLLQAWAGSGQTGVSMSANYGGSNYSGAMAAANGRAFDNGVQFFASGGVFDNPTMFRHAGGLGVMGEAGPEAIMPLTRGSDGKLGVRATGGGGSNVNMSFATQISIESSDGSDQKDSKAMAEFGDRMQKEQEATARRVLNEEQLPGGILWRMQHAA